MSAIPIIREAHAWLRWLTTRTLDACASLSPGEFRRPFPIGPGSVHATLVHLLGAEKLWIAVLEGDEPVPPMPEPGQYPDVEAIRAGFVPVRARWSALLDRLDGQELARVVVRVRDGRAYRQTVGDAMMQIPTHALYHNAQISFMFRSMGHALPDSSWIIRAREQAAAGAGR